MNLGMYVGLAALALAACDGKTLADRDPPGSDSLECGADVAGGDPMNASNWRIGPMLRINGDWTNRSVGIPRQPTQVGLEWYFDIPRQGGSVHYVTFNHGPLTGKTRIRMRYRVDMAEDVHIWPKTAEPPAPSIITLYFQRRGDDWSADAEHETHRWFASFAMQMPISAGEHEIIAPLDSNWTAIMTSSRESNPTGFAAALANAQCVGFVLGGGDGLGHGAWADGPARLIIEEFAVE